MSFIGDDHAEKRVLAGALLVLFADRLSSEARDDLDGLSAEERSSLLSEADEFVVKGVRMMGVDPTGIPVSRALRMVCGVLAEFDHVRETMEG